MIKLEFNLIGGPFGDATCRYDVAFHDYENPSGVTVQSFISYIKDYHSINTNDKWGYFSIDTTDITKPGLNKRFLSYNRGKVFFEDTWTPKDDGEKILSNIGNKYIKCILAEGGWSRMDYILFVED